MSDKAVYRTAPATPGLLIIDLLSANSDVNGLKEKVRFWDFALQRGKKTKNSF